MFNLLFLFLVISTSFAATSPLCPDEEGQFHFNQLTQTAGGFISNSALVDDFSLLTLSENSAICGKSQIYGENHILGQVVIKDSTLRGNKIEGFIVVKKTIIASTVSIHGRGVIENETVRDDLLLEGDFPNELNFCGLKGTIEERKADCSARPLSSIGNSVLVSRTFDLEEVWQDNATGLFWSHHIDQNLTFDQALKVCGSPLKETVGINEISWRLPSRSELATVKHSEINLRDTWSLSNNKDGLKGWYFNSATKTLQEKPKQEKIGTRCVGRIITGKKRTCGTSGDANSRIKDCQITPDSFKGDFVLVTRNLQNNVEVWKDTSTGLIWSDTWQLPPWGQAWSCDSFTREKGGISGIWRIPLNAEMREAHFHQIQKLPRINFLLWSAWDGNDFDWKTIYHGVNGEMVDIDRIIQGQSMGEALPALAVKCVMK